MTQIDAIMHKDVGKVPGASMLTLPDGKPLFSNGHGMANMGNRFPTTPATDYRLASVTTQFIAAAITLRHVDHVVRHTTSPLLIPRESHPMIRRGQTLQPPDETEEVSRQRQTKSG